MKLVSISGGRSSAMMLHILQENNLLNDAIVCFSNTGKESPETLEFINECSKRWGIEVVWLEYAPNAPGFKIVTFETASRNGEPYRALIEKKGYLPNPVKRICTAELKIKIIRRFVRSIGVKGHFDTYLGLRYDEPERVARKKAQNAAGKEPEVCFMPLHEMRITRKERDEFWAKQPFDLQISSISDNCDLCFLKGKSNLVWAIRGNPKSVEWWVDMEQMVTKSAKRKRNSQFRKEYSYTDLKKLALNQTYIPYPQQEKRISLTCNCTD